MSKAHKRGSFETGTYSSSGQVELEQKLRKETEDKYRKTLQRLDQVQTMLKQRTEELEAEKEQRQELENRNEKLQFTIDKLEQYLRKKSSTTESTSSSARCQSSLPDVVDLEDSLNEKANKLQQEHEKRIKAEERCKELERKLAAMGISDYDKSLQKSNLDNEIVDGELDF